MDRLSVLRSLGDGTRYAVYCLVANAKEQLSTAEVAEALGLHPNTVRPHLEGLRDAGLLSLAKDHHGTVGRPQHRYLLAQGAPFPTQVVREHEILARMLTAVAVRCEPDAQDVLEAGREHGRREVDHATPQRGSCTCLDVLIDELRVLGFDPSTYRGTAEDSFIVSFTRCPFGDLAEAHPELVCNLHRGLVEGVVEAAGGGRVGQFGTLSDSRPCQVELVVG